MIRIVPGRLPARAVRLSFRARGMLEYLRGREPDGLTLMDAAVHEDSGETRAELTSAMLELLAADLVHPEWEFTREHPDGRLVLVLADHARTAA